ncbi:C40 family peptidase [Sphingobacterium lactis]|uniref:C40 family peptidase n=1 Tax=Sphingobacterium lactis TaxID=797291 RepID=UPI003EC5C43F
MALAVCTLSSISVYQEPTIAAVRVYELLFGEGLLVLERAKEWVYIRVLETDIQGWVMEGQFEEVDAVPTYDFIVDDVGGFALGDEQATIALFHGSPMPENGVLTTKVNTYNFLNDPLKVNFGFEVERDRESLENFTATYLNKTVSHKGRTEHGLDSIGLCGLFYRHFGFELPKDLESMLTLGKAIDFISEIQDGDLAFFENEEGIVDHVGLVVSEDEVLHVREKVRIDHLDNEGLFNKDLNQVTHKLRIVKRIFD